MSGCQSTCQIPWTGPGRHRRKHNARLPAAPPIRTLRLWPPRVNMHRRNAASGRNNSPTPPTRLLVDRVAYGSPQQVADRLIEIRDELGLTGFIMEPNLGGTVPPETCRSQSASTPKRLGQRYGSNPHHADPKSPDFQRGSFLSNVPGTKPKPSGMCICRVLESGRESRGSVSALDCRTVRQRRLTSSFRLDSPARNLPTLSCTAALLPRHRLPVASSLAQPQIASSALKSGL